MTIWSPSQPPRPTQRTLEGDAQTFSDIQLIRIFVPLGKLMSVKCFVGLEAKFGWIYLCVITPGCHSAQPVTGAVTA